MAGRIMKAPMSEKARRLLDAGYKFKRKNGKLTMIPPEGSKPSEVVLPRGHLRLNAYRIISDAVEQGVAYAV